MKNATFIFFLICSRFLFAQEVELMREETPTSFYPEADVNFHSTIKPYLKNPYHKTEASFVQSRDTSKSDLTVTALVSSIYRYNESNQYRLMGGVLIESNITPRLYARFSYLGGIENATDNFSALTRFKSQNNQNVFAVNDLRGRLSFDANRFINLQAGFDENFVGEGSRSLFLSDYGVPYGFAQARMNIWRLEYMMMYQFMSETTSSNQKKNKYGATHYLNVSATKWLQFGIFETVIFQAQDTLLNRGYEPEYLNPMIFYRPQEYSLGSADNVLLGVDATMRFGKTTLYSQLILDEFSLVEVKAKSGWWASKYAIQAGIKHRFTTSIGDWLIRGEMNTVRPYTYSHLSLDQSYTHRNSTLTHPYGANFAEILAEVKWENKKWMGEMFVNYSLKGYDRDSINYGGNVFIPYINRPGDYGHTIGQGQGNNAFLLMGRLSYKLYGTGLRLFAEGQYRYNTYNVVPTGQVLIGIRSNFRSDYRNF
jgi:hypothetical protein